MGPISKLRYNYTSVLYVRCWFLCIYSLKFQASIQNIDRNTNGHFYFKFVTSAGQDYQMHWDMYGAGGGHDTGISHDWQTYVYTVDAQLAEGETCKVQYYASNAEVAEYSDSTSLTKNAFSGHLVTPCD